ncbi:hypothetical protein ACUN7V_08265 [Quadrisphaera oryzae]|uniref:hypothetical protein n=1 Tax=Quadrisphaera TaxID=317661 RepID=UPI0016445146|nr:hypothetical protein [Quadrisphaera sp. RL12-1S]MBC3763733.1 hypothetical protein [Quadrisphaera sp. RL12-1S]
MQLNVVRTRCAQMLATLGIHGPTSVQQLAEQLTQQRGRPIRLVAHPQLGEELSGTWIELEGADVVFFDDGLAGVHQQHVIAHELAHIAFEHGYDEPLAPDVLATLLPDVDPRTVRRMLQRGSYSTHEEREAEVFASMLLQLSTHPVADDLGALPADARRRAADLTATFGSRRRDAR